MISLFKYAIECAWWLVSALCVYLLLYPISSKMEYHYYIPQFAFFVITIQYCRYFIDYKSYPWLQNKWFRAVLFILNIQLAIYVVRELQGFLQALETFEWADLTSDTKKVDLLSLTEKYGLIRYIHQIGIVITSATLISIVLLNVKILLSFFGFGTKRLKNFLTSSDNTENN